MHETVSNSAEQLVRNESHLYTTARWNYRLLRESPKKRAGITLQKRENQL